MKRFIWAISVVALSALGACAQVRQTASIQEQTHFSAEDDGVKVPVNIPDDAWAILKSEHDVQGALEDAGFRPDQLPKTWFSASVVHLHSLDEKDLFVAAEGPLVGGNISQFWIFLGTDKGMKLVAEGATHDVFIRPARWRGYRIIELDGMTCCRVDTTWLRFEGGQYKDYRHVSKEIK